MDPNGGPRQRSRADRQATVSVPFWRQRPDAIAARPRFHPKSGPPPQGFLKEFRNSGQPVKKCDILRLTQGTLTIFTFRNASRMAPDPVRLSGRQDLGLSRIWAMGVGQVFPVLGRWGPAIARSRGPKNECLLSFVKIWLPEGARSRLKGSQGARADLGEPNGPGPKGEEWDRVGRGGEVFRAW